MLDITERFKALPKNLQKAVGDAVKNHRQIITTGSIALYLYGIIPLRNFNDVDFVVPKAKDVKRLKDVFSAAEVPYDITVRGSQIIAPSDNEESENYRRGVINGVPCCIFIDKSFSYRKVKVGGTFIYLSEPAKIIAAKVQYVLELDLMDKIENGLTAARAYRRLKHLSDIALWAKSSITTPL